MELNIPLRDTALRKRVSLIITKGMQCFYQKEPARTTLDQAAGGVLLHRRARGSERMINRFEGEYAFLSNFYPVPITIGELHYLSSEAAYQAQKAPMNKRALFTNLAPGQAKQLGQSMVLDPESWNAIRDNIMRRIVHAKFAQNPELAELLSATGTEELEEGNTWHDNHFGNCYCPACENIKGENMLGKILMKEREILCRK